MRRANADKRVQITRRHDAAPRTDRQLRGQLECEQIAPQAGGAGRADLSLEFLLRGHPVRHRGFEFIAARSSEREAYLPGVPIAIAAFGHYKTIALKRFDGPQQGGAIHDECVRHLTHRSAPPLIEDHQYGKLGAGYIRFRKMLLVKARDVTSRLTRRKTVA